MVVGWRGYKAMQGAEFVVASAVAVVVVVEDGTSAGSVGAETLDVAKAEWVYEKRVRQLR